MTNVLPTSTSVHQNPARHLCMRVLDKLRRTISEENNSHSDIRQDLVVVLEQALSVSSISTATFSCLFCPAAPEIIGISERIQTKFNNTRKDRALLRSIRQLITVSREFTEDFANDCCKLKELLQFIIGAHFHGNIPANSPSLLSANMLDGARDLRIEGGNNITNVAGSSNLIVFVKQEESGNSMSFRNALILLLLSFLVFCLLG